MATTHEVREKLLLKGGAVITVDPEVGVLRGDVEISGPTITRVEKCIEVDGHEVIDASDHIVMPGLVETHFHMWSSSSKNFLSDGIEYFGMKGEVAGAYEPDDVYASVRHALAEAASAGITTVHNWDHNVRSREHVTEQLRAHRESGLRARYSFGRPDNAPPPAPIDFVLLDEIRGSEGLTANTEGLIHLGVNLLWSEKHPELFLDDVVASRERGLPMAMHNGQSPTWKTGAAMLDELGVLAPDLLLCHALLFDADDRAAMGRRRVSNSLSPHSEMRLGRWGGFHEQLLLMNAEGINIALSIDATSLGPVNLFEAMRLSWNFGVPWAGSVTEGIDALTFRQVIAMATLNGARALGIDNVTGSITPGKRADIIMLRADDLNMAPGFDPEAAIVLSATPANVSDVLVDGVFVKRAGALRDNVTRIVADVHASARRVRERAGGRLSRVMA